MTVKRKVNPISFISNVFITICHCIKSKITGHNPNTKEYWNKKLAKYDSFWRDTPYNLILDLLPKDEAFSLLDIGCALGNGCQLLKRKFPNANITGADFSDVAIAKAKKHSKDIDYIVHDILRDPIPDKYDYIIIIQTLEHFDDPYVIVDKCLKHAKRSLIITTPCKQNLTINLGEHRFHFDENTFSKYNCRTVRETEYLPESAGKCIVYEIKP